MSTVKVAFKIIDGPHQIPQEYDEMKGFCIFDLKMDFTRKARWVKSGHLTASTGEFSYAGVVSWESVCLALIHAALNELDVTCGYIKQAYLSVPISRVIGSS